MYYPPGQDPYKSPEINRQDQFFHDLSRVQEKQVEDMRRSYATYSPAPARVVSPRPVRGVAPAGAGKARRAAMPLDPRLQRRKGILQLLVLGVLVGGFMILAGVAPAKAIGYTVAGLAAFIAFALVLSWVFGLIGRFFRSRAGRFTLLIGAGLALAYLFAAVS